MHHNVQRLGPARSPSSQGKKFPRLRTRYIHYTYCTAHRGPVDAPRPCTSSPDSCKSKITRTKVHPKAQKCMRRGGGLLLAVRKIPYKPARAPFSAYCIIQHCIDSNWGGHVACVDLVVLRANRTERVFVLTSTQAHLHVPCSKPTPDDVDDDGGGIGKHPPSRSEF